MSPQENAGTPGSTTGITLPKAPSVARWRLLASSRHTLLRALQYEAVRGVPLRGRVLDLGGDRRSGYHGLFDAESAVFHVVNLAPVALPDTVADLEKALPFNDASFDHVISFNTFEHLFNDWLALRESARVLRTGGTFHIVVPFCYRVHGSPRDFHRHTADWWLTALTGLGMSEVTVEPLVWDRRSSGAALSNASRLVRRILMAAALLDVKGAIAQAARSLGITSVVGRPIPDRAERRQRRRLSAASFALGYYAHGRK